MGCMDAQIKSAGPPWSDPPPHAMCNFHATTPAVAVYAGTPMCALCTERMAADGK